MSWTGGSNVVIKKSIVSSFLNELSKRVSPLGIQVYVTSGYRSPEDQVRVVCNNYLNTGGSNLSVYGQRTGDMYRQHCPDNKPALVEYETAQLKSRMDKDPNYQGHGSASAVDLRVSDLSNAKKLEYKKVLESMGAKVLWERHPEHFHVWVGSYSPPIPWSKYALLASTALLIGALTYRYHFDT